MTLSTFIHDMGISGLAFQGLLAIALLVSKRWRQFPFFFGYAWSGFAFSLAEYMLLTKRIPYFYVYWAGEALGICLGFLVVYEIFRNLFTVHRALAKLATLTFKIAGGILLFAGVIVFFMQPPSNVSNVGAAITAMEQATRIIEVGLLMSLFVCSAAFGLHWKQAEFGVALGLGFFATIELIAVTLRPLVEPHRAAWLDVLRVVAFDSSLLIWLGYLWMPERAATSVDVPQRAQLEQWNQAVMELISK